MEYETELEWNFVDRLERRVTGEKWEGKGKGKKERERERQLEIEMEREKEEWSCKLWQDLDERRSGKHLCVVRVLTAGTPRHCDVQDARICHVQVTIKTWIFGSRVCLLTMILRFQIASKPVQFFFSMDHTHEVERDIGLRSLINSIPCIYTSDLE